MLAYNVSLYVERAAWKTFGERVSKLRVLALISLTFASSRCTRPFPSDEITYTSLLKGEGERMWLESETLMDFLTVFFQCEATLGALSVKVGRFVIMEKLSG